jgi:hypothetical protein
MNLFQKDIIYSLSPAFAVAKHETALFVYQVPLLISFMQNNEQDFSFVHLGSGYYPNIYQVETQI